MIKDLLTRFGITNALGTILAILGAAQWGLEKLGCSPFADAVEVTCNLPTWIPVTWTPIVLGAAGLTALATKLLRPGTWLRNLFGPTAVVVPKAVIDTKMVNAKGVVTPEQVLTTSPVVK